MVNERTVGSSLSIRGRRMLNSQVKRNEERERERGSWSEWRFAEMISLSFLEDKNQFHFIFHFDSHLITE